MTSKVREKSGNFAAEDL